MFERFTESAKQVVVLSQEEARSHRHDHIGIEHFVVAIPRGDDSLMLILQEVAGLSVDAIRTAVYAGRRVLAEEPQGRIPFTPDAKKVLELALREALALGHDFIDSGHLLLGVIRARDRNIDSRLPALEEVRDEVLELLDETMRSRRAASSPPRRRAPRHASTSSAAAEAEELLGAVPTHRDRPASVDRLRRRMLAEVLADRLRRVRGDGEPDAGDDEAVLVHVHAPWGAGKTSLLGFLEDELARPADGGRPWVVVHFSAWQHQRVAPPWWWLLAAIRRDGMRALRSVSRRRALRFWVDDVAWRLWNARPALASVAVVALLALAAWRTDVFGIDDRSIAGLQAVAVAISALVALGVTLVGTLRGVGRWLAFGPAPPGARLLYRVHDPMRASQRRFAFLVRALRDPVAIFIDDLDRCRADYVVELLEGVQTLFLDQPVVFVVAADRRWLGQSYEVVYEPFRTTAGDAGRPLGHLFLEKTFQLSFEVQPPSPEVCASYWSELVRGAADAESPVPAAAAASIERRFASMTSEREILAAVSAVVENPVERELIRRAAVRRLSSTTLEQELRHALERFSHLIEPNPRGMKRLVNAYGLERALAVRGGLVYSEEVWQQSVLWTIVRLRWPVLADAVRADPELADVLSGVARGSGGQRPEHVGELFDRVEVRSVFVGVGTDVQLTSDAIRTLGGDGAVADADDADEAVAVAGRPSRAGSG